MAATDCSAVTVVGGVVVAIAVVCACIGGSVVTACCDSVIGGCVARMSGVSSKGA